MATKKSAAAAAEAPKAEPTSAPAPEPLKPEPGEYDFDAFVAFGIKAGANVVNGMPWSFMFAGYYVTHENNDLYLVGNWRFVRGDKLIVAEDGSVEYRAQQASEQDRSIETSEADAVEDPKLAVAPKEPDDPHHVDGGMPVAEASNYGLVGVLVQRLKARNDLSDNEVLALRSLKQAANLLAGN